VIFAGPEILTRKRVRVRVFAYSGSVVLLAVSAPRVDQQLGLSIKVQQEGAVNTESHANSCHYGYSSI